MERNQLIDLVKKLPNLANTRMLGHGHVVWVSWQGEPASAMGQTFLDYGGIRLATDRHQSLWFFFNTDVFLALARLEIWARLNPMPVFVQVMPGNLPVGYKLEVSLNLDSALGKQHAPEVDEFTVLVHPKSVEAAKSIPGLVFKDAPKTGGLAPQLWKRMEADQRLPYTTSMGWYVVLKPLGNALDKAFQSGWREYFFKIEPLTKRLKVQYITQDFFLMLPLSNLRELRQWCKEYLLMVAQAKQEGSAYWPCVQSIVEKKGLNFNTELYKKILLDWDQLAPDFPHMSYRTALLMGEGFHINDVRFKVDEGTLDDWCNVSLEASELGQENTLHVELPTRLVVGPHGHCFYCGQRSHPMQECPSRHLEELDSQVWEQLTLLDFSAIEKGLNEVDGLLAKDADALNNLLRQETVPALLVRAMFEIGSVFQFRMQTSIWRAVGREYPRGLQQLGPKTNDAHWEGLSLLQHGDLVNLDRLITKELFKNPRSLPLTMLRGFSALERGDMLRAASVFGEAEKLASTPVQQSSVVFLQGRVLEVQGKLQQASNFYKRALQVSPRWLDAAYRQSVCQVKMGFAEQAFTYFQDVITRNPNFFNYVLLDPELERGHMQMLVALSGLWAQAQQRAAEERALAEDLRDDLGKWFPEGHPYQAEMAARITEMMKLTQVENYVAYARLSQQRVALSKEMMLQVEEESRRIKKRFTNYLERLKVVRHESSWFPFPKLLVEFNKEFNFCAKSINWSHTQHFQVAENFRKAADLVETVEDKLDDLEDRLKTLKIVRDSTLFVILMFKSFLWLGLGSMIVSLLALPLLSFYGGKVGMGWAEQLTFRQQLELQGGMFVVLAIISLAVAALRTALIFDKRKERLFREAEAQARTAESRANPGARGGGRGNAAASASAAAARGRGAGQGKVTAAKPGPVKPAAQGKVGRR
ncbi:tetratricopeptide repeat protein [Megalodesulfovibrio paquesii]